MPKGSKPHQEIYRPGSGPLKKTNHGSEDVDSDTNVILRQNQVKTTNLNKIRNDGLTPQNNDDVSEITTKLGDARDFDQKKKTRKPELQLYVPRGMAQAQAKEMNENHMHSGDRNSSSHVNGNSNYYNNSDRNNASNRSKRYSVRRTGNASDNHGEWRARSPGMGRNLRQGSEPRTTANNVQNNSNWNRTRDTKSVEPNVIQTHNVNDKLYSKPPSGRRHSTIGLDEKHYKMKYFDTLPPRLQKKFLEENKLNINQITSEEVWDGSSVTFQGSHIHHSPKQNLMSKSNYPLNNYNTLQGGPQHHYQNNNPNSGIYYTLPHRPRGRGRYQVDYEAKPGPHRSVTPDKMYLSPSNSRPSTPIQVHNSNEPRSHQSAYVRHVNNDKHHQSHQNCSVFRNDDRQMKKDLAVNELKVVEEVTPRPFRKSLEEQLSPISPETPKEKELPTANPSTAKILDWSEEVELNELLEAEALSDALTRSSSVTSLMDTSIKSTASSNNKKSKKRKSGRKSRKRSSSRSKDKCMDPATSSYQDEPRTNRNDNQRTRQNSYNSVDSNRDAFKVPENNRNRRRRGSRDKRENSFERYHNRSRNVSRESSFDRTRKTSGGEYENWREEIRSRQNSEREVNSRELERKPSDIKKGGLIVLPKPETNQPPVLTPDRPRLQEVERRLSPGQKSLFDPNNPTKPIIVKNASSSRASMYSQSNENSDAASAQYTTDVHGNLQPRWYDENSTYFKSSHFQSLIKEVKRADSELQFVINADYLMINWAALQYLRKFLMDGLEYLLCNDLAFSQTENIEQHFWKILFHNIIEMMRKAITSDPENKEKYKTFLLALIDEGTKYFEHLLEKLECSYNFKIHAYLNNNQSPQQGHKYLTLALVSSQKIFLFLGDLGRYREQINESLNYGKCRQWYIKAHEINPKNGKPYNQLAIIAVYARRKLDAVYYYMRSLMSSNPVPSARENLSGLFDDIRKKYEQGERKRREERLERARQHMKEKESETKRKNASNSVRRETWIHPDSGRREHRTTSAMTEKRDVDSEEEDLAALSSVDVNKRFVISYLHVHGKLFTKIGMETFQETAIQMLKEFRALLQHSPLPIPCNRLLQLLALNMFAIESTQLKDPQLQSQNGYRSELQERALVVSLQMFNLILERCVSLLQEHINTKQRPNLLPQDVHVLLPAVKIWCDWLLCHSAVWNPPPSTQDYRIGPPGDAWSRLASLVNYLQKLDLEIVQSFIQVVRDGFELVRLPEDAVLSGFTPLICNVQEPTYVPQDLDMETAQFGDRIKKLLFFGTVFLCGLEPPVLKLELENDVSEYISVVCTSANRSQPPSPPELINDDEVLVESCTEEDEELDSSKYVENAPTEIRDLLSKKIELEKKQRHQELHRQRAQKILKQAFVSVEIEVRPKYLVPDTNCFIDHLDKLQTISEAHVYTLMVSLVVLGELEGLAKGGKASSSRTSSNPQHVVKVAENAKFALEFLAVKHANVKCITTKGTILPSTTFTVEDDSTADIMTNDDKILATCLALCKNIKDLLDDEPRKLFREVVLLTDDRNLRVKALARDVPVRELPDFMQWAGLGG